MNCCNHSDERHVQISERPKAFLCLVGGCWKCGVKGPIKRKAAPKKLKQQEVL